MVEEESLQRAETSLRLLQPGRPCPSLIIAGLLDLDLFLHGDLILDHPLYLDLDHFLDCLLVGNLPDLVEPACDLDRLFSSVTWTF